jgi:hypothetical protein
MTANHIVRLSLIINGNAATPGLVAIAASDASGNPLALSSGLAVAGSIAAASSGSTIVSGTLSSSSLPASGGLTGESGVGASLAASGVNLGGAAAAVPEPSAIVLHSSPWPLPDTLSAAGGASASCVGRRPLSLDHRIKAKPGDFLPGFFFGSSFHGGFGMVARRLEWRH